MKDISNNIQPSFLLMKIDENGDKHWRFNFNVVEKTDEENNPYFECDFVPNEGGLISEHPKFDLFVDELKSIGLNDSEIENIGSNVQL